LLQHIPGLVAALDDDNLISPTQNPVFEDQPGDGVVLGNKYAVPGSSGCIGLTSYIRAPQPTTRRGLV
jgi:hypothetical protein